MDKNVILVSQLNDDLDKICQLLSKNAYAPFQIDSTDQIGETLSRISSNCIILDLDTIDVDNRAIRELTVEYPSAYFLCMSKDRFHPELKDAICYHIYACLTKPLDPDELLYWLRCIDNELDDSPSSNNHES